MKQYKDSQICSAYVCRMTTSKTSTGSSECFQWKTHGQCSKGDSCSFSDDKQVQGDLYGGQTRKGRSSSPAPKSKAKTDEGEEKSSKNIRQQRGRQKERNSVQLQKLGKKKSHENVGILPCVETTSLRPDANVEEHVSSNMLRLRRSPARSQRKVVRKDQWHY